MEKVDLAIVGAGAAGLMAAIFAGRAAPGSAIVALDGAPKLGAKILVAGGGRCNVTHDVVDERAYAGSSPNAIRKVLRRFDVSATTDFFREIGVELKLEPTGKLFPVTDSARTVLDALMSAAAGAGVTLRHPQRVTAVRRAAEGFVIEGPWGAMAAHRLILATGGKALPKSGSDGLGYTLAQSLGHSVTRRIIPALVPLVLPDGHFLRGLSGISADVEIAVRTTTGKLIKTFTDALLCTHFGVSGPAVLDISRYWTMEHLDHDTAALTVNWLPGVSPEGWEAHIVSQPKQSIYRHLHDRLSDRLARALVEQAGLAVGDTFGGLTRESRRRLVQRVTALPLPVTGDRGFTYAEVTAGGVPLKDLRLETMESRIVPGLYLCGEICDVDGRIGGYNFQWAWSSGYVAGVSALDHRS